MRFLGIDPGLVKTGFAILDDDRLITSGTIKKNGSTIDRIHKITLSLAELIKEYQPECSGIETIFYGKNPKSLIHSAQLVGAIIYLLKEQGLDIIQLHPNVIKKAITGSGRASKTQVSYMVRQLLQLNTKPTGDESDAIAITLATKFHYDRRD